MKIEQGLDYTVIDLDGDGTEELLISGTQGTVVFHIAGDKVRAYQFGLRYLLEPKIDGTFEWTDLMFSGKVGVSRMSFTDEGYTVEDICYYLSGCK